MIDNLLPLEKEGQTLSRPVAAVWQILPLELLAREALHNPVFDARLLSGRKARQFISWLKSQVDIYQWRENERAAELAQLIVRIGRQRTEPVHEALGLMALGDTIAITGNRHQEAWALHQEAGALFLRSGDRVGWARTQIGRVAICLELDHVAEAMADARRAAAIFKKHGELDLYVRLAVNLMKVHNELGRYRQTIHVFDQALPAALALGEAGEKHLGLLYNNVANAYQYRGELHRAREYLTLAVDVLTRRNQSDARRVVLQNVAYVEQALGQYQRALKLLHEVLEAYAGRQTIYTIHLRLLLAECYLQLNKNMEARELTRETVEDLAQFDQPLPNEMAHTLRQLAEAEAKLGRLPEAQEKLQQAQAIFTALQAETWQQSVQLMRSSIALEQGDYLTSLQMASQVAAFFAGRQQQVNQVRALLLKGRSLFALQRLAEAHCVARKAQQLARVCRVPDLRYGAHLLLGQVYEAHGQVVAGRRHYHAALSIVERLQSSLTITLRTNFLENKNEALHGVMRLALAAGDVESAFETLERSKSQMLLGYLANRQRLYWSRGDEHSQRLIAQLDQLREEHHLLYGLAHETAVLPDEEPALEAQEAGRKLAACERQMRQVTEQLYLSGADQVRYNFAPFPGREAIQARIPAGTALVEYYNDGRCWWAFVVDSRHIQVVQLPLSLAEVEQLIHKLHFNIRTALQAGAGSRMAGLLAGSSRQLGQLLYGALLASLPLPAGLQRLIVVPYGLLHYLPFNLLHTGERYLIEAQELVMLPAAALITRETPGRPAGALVLAHSYNGQVPQTIAEAEAVSELFAGRVYTEEQTNRHLLEQPPQQILHIAAHGRHRIDQPDLSFIQLGDGQLYTDDLLQQDLSYELVTLSACETGRAVVKPGEELIGLGRGVLCAGAAALVASLWRVTDEHTAGLMGHFYTALRTGKTRAAALREAQCSLLAREPELHPAFWAAFHLIGAAGPLSATAGNGVSEYPKEQRA